MPALLLRVMEPRFLAGNWARCEACVALIFRGLMIGTGSQREAGGREQELRGGECARSCKVQAESTFFVGETLRLVVPDTQHTQLELFLARLAFNTFVDRDQQAVC